MKIDFIQIKDNDYFYKCIKYIIKDSLYISEYSILRILIAYFYLCNYHY
jgi:hypothetical protein